MTRRLLGAVLVGVAFAASPSTAHHFAADYEDRTVTIEGTIEGVTFTNPHVVLAIRTKDAGVYTATWRAPSLLTRNGVQPNHLKVGDEVAVSGRPSRIAADLSGITEVRRLADGWAWRVDAYGRISVGTGPSSRTPR
jgi:hypothetical protein